MATLTTPIYGLPWPDGAERVMDGDNAIGALASAVESVLAGHGVILQAMLPSFNRSASALVLTTTDAPVPGCSVSFNPAGTETGLIIGIFDAKITTTGCGAVLGATYVDGAARPGTATYYPGGTVVGQETVTQMWTAGLVPGTRTIELRARKSVAGGVASIESAGLSTNLIVIRFRTTPVLLSEVAAEIAEELTAGA